MGLDISYYSNLKLSGPKTGKESDWEDHDLRVWNEECFTYQLGSLKKDHLYDRTPSSHYGGFRAGSYGGYNQWRNELSKMVGYSSANEVWNDKTFDSFKICNHRKDKLDSINGVEIERIKPFYELINFSDAEGMIGPEISRKLYEDFINFDKQAKKYADNNNYDWFYRLYQEWTDAFKTASQNGAVLFC